MLSARGLAAIRGERLVLRGLDFDVPAGGALLLHGANGAGKSTLLRILAGLLRPDAGALRWRGADMLAEPLPAPPRVAYLGHRDAVKPGFGVMRNLCLSPRPGSASARTAALAGQGLSALAELPARLLSAGQSRRLALARLSLSPAPIWLLDEPATGLDDAAIARLAGLLAGHRQGGGVVVAATHVPLPLPGAATLRL